MSATPRRRRRAWLLALGLVACATGPPAPAPGPQSDALAGLEASLHQAVNALRAGHGLVALRRDAALDAVARAHSADMARRAYLAHESPEGANPVHRLERAGVRGISLAAENAGLTNRAPPNQEILRGWLASPVHRVNLLAPAFNATGVGIARAPDGTLFYTQVYVTVPRRAGPR